jgi:hypothetical protein
VKRGENLGDLDIDRNIILKQILDKVCEGMDWIHLIQDKVQGLALES